MSPVRNGVQWTSRVSPRTRTVALPVATALALPVALVPPSAVAATDYRLMSRSARLARPVTGTAWTTMRDLAQNLGTPDLCDQDDEHHPRTITAALVSARIRASGHPTVAIDGRYLLNPG
jgi:hypothetical protein